MDNITRKIVPNLWYDRQAEEAVNLYTSVFKESKISNVTCASKAGFDVHGLSESTVMTIEFEIEGQRFAALNGGPLFKFNPSISFLVKCITRKEVDSLWDRLSQEGGPALMELGAYSFSERYGWTKDRYGLSWQLMLVTEQAIKQKIIPTMMFVGEQSGRTEEAVTLYTTVFNNSTIDHIMRYGKDEEPDKEGTIRHAGFKLEGQEFAAMDSAREHNFSFNEAISFIVQCQTQQEIDYYWKMLTTNGGEEIMCGWLKDKIGVSWQIVPTVLGQMLQDHDAEKVERVTNAFLKMKKFDIEELKKAYDGNSPVSK